MIHLSEEQLILHYFSESEDPAQVEKHLAACPECRAQLSAIQRTINLVDTMPVPERGPAYGAQVWTGVRASLGLTARPRRPVFLMWQTWAAVAATVVLAVGSFLAGRHFPSQSSTQLARSSQEASKRILMVSLGDHLDQSQRMLMELANSEPGELPAERESAQDLLASNRLYRQSVQKLGDPKMADLLDELELFLTEAAHAGPDELAQLQRRMVERGILLQVRLQRSQISSKRRAALPLDSF
jgi:hypothetical protein